MSQTRKQKPKIGEFIMAYRKIIILALFFIILPIVVTIGVYTGTKANGEKIYFAEGSNEHHSARKFVDVEKFDTFNLDVDYYELKHLYDKEDSEKLVGQTYVFYLNYTKALIDVSDVKITPVLVGPWSTYKSFKNEIKLTEGSRQLLSVDFQKIAPYAPLLFVKVNNPMLYLKVNYKTAGIEVTNFVKFDLNSDNTVKMP